MKRVKDIIKLQENIEPSGPTEFTDADGSSAYDDNQGGNVTGGGRVQNYPVSAANIRWLRTQGGPFSFGFLGSHTLENLTKELLGTDLSASVIKDAKAEYDALGDRQVEEQNAASAYFTGEYQTIDAEYDARREAAIAAENYVLALSILNEQISGPHVQEYNRLTAIYTATSHERSALLTRMSDYIMGGKINPSDPYGLDHPELAGGNKPDTPKPTDPKVKRLKDLLDKASKNPASLTDAEKQELIDAGFDDFVLGGETASPIGDLIQLGLTYVAAKALIAVYGVGGPIVAQALKNVWANEWGKRTLSDVAYKKFLATGKMPPGIQGWRPFKAFTLDMLKTGPTVGASAALTSLLLQFLGGSSNQNQSESYLHGDSFVLTESKKRVIKNIKKPYEVPELPKKYKMNFAGKYSAQNTPDKTASQVSDALVASGNAKGQRWRQKDKDWVGYETTERMNVVYDKVGHGDQYWKMIVGDNARKKKDRELQEKLNIVAHENALMQENPNYETPFNKKHIDEQETLSADKDPLFKKVSKSLKKSIDYPDKPAKAGYPNDPPPKMINGYHPDLVNGQKVSNYYNRLDPASAMAMPKTGNDSIDSKVDLAKNGEYPKDSPAAADAAKRHGLDKLRSNPRTDANVKRISDAKRRARKLKNLKGKG